MTTDIADILKSQINALPFIDKLAGLVKTVVISDQNESGQKIKKSFPIACNVSGDECVNNGAYKDLTPNNSYKSVLYFEEAGGTQLTGIERGKMHFRSQVRLVGWLNLKKMGLTDCQYSSTAVLQIIRELSAMIQPGNYGNKYIHLRVTGINEIEKSSAIFGRYTYDESINQYLVYPFDYFALNISVEFSVNPSCIENEEIPDIELCDDNGSTPETPSTPIGECWDFLRWDCDRNMWVRFAAPLTEGTWVLQRNEDGSFEWVEESSGGGGGSGMSCDEIDSCEVIQQLVEDSHSHSNKSILDAISAAFTTSLKSTYDSAAAWISTNGTNIVNHLSNTSNPHNVTKAQVGLGNVDNTSDLNKPVSTAQAAADSAVASAAALDATTKANTAETNAKAYADTLVVGLIDDRGNYDASGNVFPSSGGSGTAGAILKGDLWTINVAGTLGGNAVTAGDLVRALVDTPGQTSSNWAITENNIGYVAENQSNKATSMSGNTTSNTAYLSAKAVYDWVISLGYQAALTAANFGSFINGLSAKSTLVDADMLALMDSADSNNSKKLSWADLKSNIKSTLGHYTVAKTTTGTTITGSTAQTIVMSQLISGGTFQSGDIPEIYFGGRKSGTNGTGSLAFYINTSNSLSGATLIATSSAMVSATRTTNSQRTYGYFSSSTVYNIISTSTSSNGDNSNVSSTELDATWNTANDYYLIVAVQLNNSSDSYIPKFLLIKNNR